MSRSGRVAFPRIPWLRRNLSLDVLSSVGVGVMLAMVVVAAAVSAARQAGMAPIVLALLAAVPFIANLLSAFGSRLGAHSTRQLGLMRVRGRRDGAARRRSCRPPRSWSWSVFAFWLSLALGGPFHVRVWGQIYPAHARGRVLGLFGSARSAALAIAAFAGGMLADQIGGFTAIARDGHDRRRLRPPATSACAPRPRRMLPAYTARSSFGTLLSKPDRCGASWSPTRFYGAGVVAAPCPCSRWSTSTGWTCRWARSGFIGVIGAIVTTATTRCGA